MRPSFQVRSLPYTGPLFGSAEEAVAYAVANRGREPAVNLRGFRLVSVQFRDDLVQFVIEREGGTRYFVVKVGTPEPVIELASAAVLGPGSESAAVVDMEWLPNPDTGFSGARSVWHRRDDLARPLGMDLVECRVVGGMAYFYPRVVAPLAFGVVREVRSNRLVLHWQWEQEWWEQDNQGGVSR